MLNPFKRINTTDKLRDAANYIGSPYFSPDTMRYFSSRLSSHIRPLTDTTGYFIISNRNVHAGWPREYAVVYYAIERTTDDFGSPTDTIKFDTQDRYDSMRAATKAMAAL